MDMNQKFCIGLAALLALCACSGCSRAQLPEAEPAPETTVLAAERGAPEIPEKLEVAESGVPVLRVYDTAAREIRKMDVETYLQGVLAGEMRSDWPLEALKAQAILARTFVMQFVGEKQSQYAGADISTDVAEAQAYSAEKIDENVKKAVEETRGQVVTAGGELIHAWFHAHAGGRTEVPSVGLDYKEGDPAYIAPVDSPDSEDAPADVKHWSASFSAAEVGKACADAGVKTGDVTEIEIESRGESGRVERFRVNGKSVSAPALRINLDASKLKSTLIERVRVADGRVKFSGSGYGHGVGLSQWGAYGMAREGRSAGEIIGHYFQNTEIVRMWD